MELKSARIIAEKELREKWPERMLIMDEHTRETPNSWVFFWDAKEWVMDRDRTKRLYGNCPILVDKRSGRVRWIPTYPWLDKHIASIEEELRRETI